MCARELDEDVSTTITTHEAGILRSIGVISLCGVVLYVCGFVWRSSYFWKLGVPPAIVDYPLPRMLIPHATVVVFIAQAALTFAARKYHAFYERQKRLRRGKMMGLSYPLDELIKYAVRKNADSSRSTYSNHEVFIQFVGEHVKRNMQASGEWKFDRESFAKEATQLFPDLSPEMADSFVWYELQLFAMDRREIEQTVIDSVGHQPRGSRYYEKADMYFSAGGGVFLLIGAILWTANILPTIIAALLGGGTGFMLSHMSDVEDRYQFWHTAWVAVLLLIIVNGIDGYVLAARNRAEYSLPFVTITGTDGASRRGVLLAEFSDAYAVEPYDMDDPCLCLKIHKQGVRTVEIRDTWRLEAAKRMADRALRMAREETDKLTKMLGAGSDKHPQADANTPQRRNKIDPRDSGDQHAD